MEILFGIIVLALLILGWKHRKKADKKWLQEERYDESGAWIDKRAGERGAYGSLDDAMEKERRDVRKQSDINELARLIQSYCFEYYPDFHALTDAQIKEFMAFAKVQVAGFIGALEEILGGNAPEAANGHVAGGGQHPELKKKILAFSFGNFPATLELEITVIKKIDLLAAQLVDSLTHEIEQLKKTT